jgi:hypothetical protein
VRPVSGTSAKRLAARIPGVVAAYESWHRHRAERAAVARRRDDETELRGLGAGRDLRLNIGSSDNALDGWINVDIRPGDHSFVNGRDAAVALSRRPGRVREQRALHRAPDRRRSAGVSRRGLPRPAAGRRDPNVDLVLTVDAVKPSS